MPLWQRLLALVLLITGVNLSIEYDGGWQSFLAGGCLAGFILTLTERNE